jgi:TRAP-type C4-dicarboxylate transport system permease small subunit
LAALLRGVIVALALIMLGALSLQISVRFFIGDALAWSEEVSVASFSWAMLLSIALGVRQAIHVRMDLLVDCLPASLQRGLDKLVALAVAGLGIFLDSLGTTSAAIGYPIAYLYACAPVCGALIALFSLERAFLGAPLPAAGGV